MAMISLDPSKNQSKAFVVAYLSSGVTVECRLELGDRRGNLQALGEDLALALKTDVLGPLHHAREVTLGLDVLANAEVAGALLDEGVLVAHNVRGPMRDGSFDAESTYLGSFLRALADAEGGRRGLLTGSFGRLSWRKKKSANVFHWLKSCLNSRETGRPWHF
jgi:hypothetical protein